ncbi:MAG: alpha/beta hydrolase, partial [Acidimicrobiia bacterium]
MRRVIHVSVCLAVMALGFALPGIAPAEESELAKRRVEFNVSNPKESGASRTVVGYRYDPPCKASTVVLLQHGLSYHKEAWDFPGYSVAQPLARAGYAVVAIDRLGYGESPIGSGYDVTFEAYADMAHQIVGQLRSEFDHVVVGGHSAGAGLTEYAQGLYGSADAILALGWHHRPSDQLGFEFITGDSTRALQADFEYFWGTPEHRAEMFYEPDADPAVVEADTRAANLVPSGEVLSISKQPSRYVAAQV